jgi:DNA-binding response OmpR family regulator
VKESVLLIEDNDSIRNSLYFSLQKEGYQVLACNQAETALTMLTRKTVDLILLDLMLPKMSGEEFLEAIGEKMNIPIIVISALNDEFTQINLYNKKIDDFVVKPFSMNILLLKIEVVLRRSSVKKAEQKKLHYQNICLEIGNYIVYQNGQRVELTAKEFEVLQAMLLNQGKVFSRDEFLTALWGYDYFVDSRTIDVHIKNLRNKLGKQLIETVKGVGYRIEKQAHFM